MLLVAKFNASAILLLSTAGVPS